MFVWSVLLGTRCDRGVKCNRWALTPSPCVSRFRVPTSLALVLSRLRSTMKMPCFNYYLRCWLRVIHFVSLPLERTHRYRTITPCKLCNPFQLFFFFHFLNMLTTFHHKFWPKPWTTMKAGHEPKKKKKKKRIYVERRHDLT